MTVHACLGYVRTVQLLHDPVVGLKGSMVECDPESGALRKACRMHNRGGALSLIES